MDLSEPLVAPVFNDVLDGSNGGSTLFGTAGFNAGPNYDNTTGLGSFNGQNLLAQFVLLPSMANTNPPPAPTDMTIQVTATSANLAWRGAAGDRGFVVFVENQATGKTFTSLTRQPEQTITKLTPNSTYDYLILSVSQGGLTSSQRQFFSTPGK